MSKNEESNSDDQYVANPINAYLLIKRLTSDWKYITSLMKSNNADSFIRNITMDRINNGVTFSSV